ncbi:MAG: HesA/MoeB/ThiF family protein [Nitrospirota bacterium]
MLSENERKRYDRQMMMEGWGREVQEKLKGSTVFVAGAGGLGSPVSMYLAAAGVGTIRICDFDTPDWTNLNRQILHNHGRLSTNKALSAGQTLRELNPDVAVQALPEKIVAENVDELVGEADLVMDCMDNFPTRYLLNESAIRKGIPLVFGSIWGMEGRLSFIHAPETPCLRCMFPEAPPQETFPVVGTTPGVIGTLQALEAIKHLSGQGQTLKGQLLVWDGGRVEFRKFKAYRDPECPTCGGGARPPF